MFSGLMHIAKAGEAPLSEGYDVTKLINICDPDMTVSYCTSQMTGASFNLGALKSEIRPAVKKTEKDYKDINVDGLAPVRELCSFDDAHPQPLGCIAKDVTNPKQPNMPLEELMILCHEKAPILGQIAVAAAEAGGCSASKVPTNIKTPWSLRRKQHSGQQVPCDLLRASAACKDGAGIMAAYEAVTKVVAGLGGRIVTRENFFKEPIGGYMDMCLQIELPSKPSGFVCELQLQLEAMKTYKDKTAHHTYAWSRLILPQHDFTEDTYIGSYKKGGEHFKGTLTKASWEGVQFDGAGEFFEDEKVTKGQWRDGCQHGDGEIRWADGDLYKGQIVGTVGNSVGRHGDGEQTSASTYRRYKGQWCNDKQTGNGEEFLANGSREYTGQWENAEHHGDGHLTLTDGTWYKGQFQNHKFHGQGVLFDPDTGSTVKGKFKLNDVAKVDF
jgi:hypothetical protein